MVDSPLTIYLIGQAHLNPVWQWRWTEGCAEIRSTCRAALDFLAADPTLKFTRSSAGELRWLERVEPALLARMAEAVHSGQWESVGWWTQPDCNIPNGEVVQCARRCTRGPGFAVYSARQRAWATTSIPSATTPTCRNC